MSDLNEFMRYVAMDYELVRFGTRLIAAGLPERGRRVREAARRSVRRLRRYWLRCDRRLRAELGYRDLGGES